MDPKITSFVKTLKEKKLSLALAESITSGMAAEKLATVIGTSEIFMGSIVCYDPSVKTGLLRVPEKTIKKFSCESRQVTEKLAQNLAKLIRADIHAALTGLASPGGSETKDKPVGTVFICVIYKRKKTNLRRVFRGTPTEIRKKACLALYQLILRAVKEKGD